MDTCVLPIYSLDSWGGFLCFSLPLCLNWKPSFFSWEVALVADITLWLIISNLCSRMGFDSSITDKFSCVEYLLALFLFCIRFINLSIGAGIEGLSFTWFLTMTVSWNMEGPVF